MIDDSNYFIDHLWMVIFIILINLLILSITKIQHCYQHNFVDFHSFDQYILILQNDTLMVSILVNFMCIKSNINIGGILSIYLTYLSIKMILQTLITVHTIKSCVNIKFSQFINYIHYIYNQFYRFLSILKNIIIILSILVKIICYKCFIIIYKRIWLHYIYLSVKLGFDTQISLIKYINNNKFDVNIIYCII